MAIIPGTQPVFDSNPENPIRDVDLDSSWLSHATYNQLDQSLVVTVRRGDVYKLDGVPPEVADEFFRAGSKGQFYNDNLKGRYSGDILVSLKK